MYIRSLYSFLISTTCTLIGIVNTVSYGPSVVSLTRWDRLSRGPTIFNPDTGRIISLEDYPNYSVVIPLAPDSASASSNQVFISRRVSGPGEFTVEAPPGYGVMAVIQNLDLRVAGDACNDFILFSEVEGGGGAETTGTCGKVDIRDQSPTPQGLVGPRSFVSSSGRMKILFYHGFIWGLVRNFNFDIFDSNLNPELKVEIAFTAFKNCPTYNETEKEEFNEHEPHLNNINLFGSCSPVYANSKTCIRQELFCDEVLNCAFSEDFGSDEDQTDCLLSRSNTAFSKAQHSPSTTTISSTTDAATFDTTSIKVPNSFSLSPPSLLSSFSLSSQPESGEQKSISDNKQLPPVETKTEKSVEKVSTNSSGEDSVGSVRHVPKFSHVEILKPNNTKNTIVIKALPSTTEHSRNKTHSPANVSKTLPSRSSSTLRTTTTTTLAPTTHKSKMPLDNGGELFVDFKADPIEDSLIDGVSKEENFHHQREFESMSPQAIAGIFSLTAILLILLGALRVYYCYNKVIWNPHGNLKSSKSPPEIPNFDLTKKTKAFASKNADIFSDIHEKKGAKEQPPSYEILFPLPEEKQGNLNV